MIAALFALSLATAQPGAGLSTPSADASRAVGISVVYLNCQVGQTALTDCKVVGDEPVDDKAAATALKLAADMTIPPALAAANPGRITVKLNVSN